MSDLNMDVFPSKTNTEQIEVENDCKNCLKTWQTNWKNIKLNRENHVYYLKNGLEKLSSSFQSLDASKPWICYWILHSLELLHEIPNQLTLSRVVSYLKHCSSTSGGYGGGPGQLPHLAPTYAAINALLICGTEEAYESIDRKALYDFLLSLRIPGCGFRVHKNGEGDIRGAYCAISVAAALNLLTEELTSGVAEWIASCQTYEGGLGGDVFNEAHGGYSFCGFATLFILKKTHLIDMKAFLKWATKKQMTLEGGFQGRANKLVDGCYSFWQGSLFPLIDQCFLNPGKYKENHKAPNQFGPETGGWCFNQIALQEYILACCQVDSGGLRDKPKKGRDYYHTCYCLSGLSVAQHNPHYLPDSERVLVLGLQNNLLVETDAVHNISKSRLQKAKNYFENLQSPPFD